MSNQGQLVDYGRALLRLVRSQLARETGYLFLGNVLQAASIFVSLILLVRLLSAEEFGQFSLVYAFLGVMTAFADLGLNTGMIRYGAEAIGRREWSRARYVFRVNLEWRLIGGGLAALAGYVAAPLLAEALWHNGALTSALRVALIGGLGIVLLSYVTSVQIACQRFFAFLMTMVTVALLRIGVLVALVYSESLSIHTAVLVFVLAPLVVAVAIQLLGHRLPVDDRVIEPIRERKRLLSFSAWVAGSAVFVALTQRIDVALIGYYLPVALAGVYAMAQQFAFAVQLGAGALTTALLPRVSALDLPALHAYVRRVLYYIPAVLVGFVSVAVAAHFVIPVVLGEAYRGAVYIFEVLLIGQFIGFVMNPLGIVLFRLERPATFTALNALQLVIVGLAGWVLIPPFGLFGAAFGAVVAQAAGAALIAYFLQKTLRSAGGRVA